VARRDFVRLCAATDFDGETGWGTGLENANGATKSLAEAEGNEGEDGIF